MRSFFRKIHFSSLAIVLGFLFYCGESMADPAKYPQFAQQHLPQGVTPEFIYLNQLVDDIVKGKRPFIIDVRSAEEYQESHIKASVSIPLSEMSRQLEKIPKDRPLVLYWACPHHLASLAYGILHQKGYKNMKVLHEGFPGWIQRSYPLEGKQVK